MTDLGLIVEQPLHQSGFCYGINKQKEIEYSNALFSVYRLHYHHTARFSQTTWGVTVVSR